VSLSFKSNLSPCIHALILVLSAITVSHSLRAAGTLVVKPNPSITYGNWEG